MVRFSTAHEWLSWINAGYQSEIKLGLDRVKAVAARLKVLNFTQTVITIGGTNGKGSTLAGLEAIYRAAGYRVGTFTSPYLLTHNELIRVNGQCTSDEVFCQAFEEIEDARQDIYLTPFEFNTLAALLVFNHHPLDILLLEVGLGGRLDAVNIIDADLAVITSIGIDHTAWLGETREAIAREKAGICRPHIPVVCGDIDPPHSLLAHAQKISSPLFCQGKDFSYTTYENNWTWQYLHHFTLEKLPFNTLATQNMSTALMSLTVLQPVLPISYDAICQGLHQVKLPARVQIVKGPVLEIYDVAHNPAAIHYLAKRIKQLSADGTRSLHGNTYAVFSMLADKDINTCIKMIDEVIDEWYIAALSVKRAATIDHLSQIFSQLGIHHKVKTFQDIQLAYQAAKQNAKIGDSILIFGSFYTVGSILSGQ